MQKFKIGDGANPNGTAKDAIIGVQSGTKYKSIVWNDNLFNLFEAVEKAGYTLIDDDISQLHKALKGLYVPSYTYNTLSIVTQTVNDVVLGSDGIFYEAQSNGINGDDPVGSVTGNWKRYKIDDISNIIVRPTNNIPIGYLECNGAEISRTIYGLLFAVIGTSYGVGDGSTTFNIPDLRGEFIRGFDNGKGVDSGRTIASNQTDDNKSHNHREMGSGGGSYHPTAGVSSGTLVPYHDTSLGGAVYTSSSGGGESRPINIAMMYCIKY